MAKKVNDVIKQARYILGDTAEQPRYTTDELVSHVTSCIGETKRIRPDMFDGKQEDELPIVNESDEFPLDILLFIPVVFYVAGMAELVDDEHVSSARAAGLMQQFKASLISPI